MAWSVWATVDGHQTKIATYATQNLARWWAIAWLKAGWVPIYADASREVIVPASQCKRLEIRDDAVPT